MKVHPLLPPKKRSSSLSEPHRFIMARQKKLRRLPHIFARVLELPFNSDADVLVEENPNFFRFVIITNDVDHDVRAHTIEIHPGVMKIVIGGSHVLELSLNELELDLWRFRLPSSTRPELTSVVYVDGKLIVTVPKGANSGNSNNYGDQEVDEEGIWRDGNGDLKGRVGRFVLVQ